jgi:hypothetical protein
VPSSPIAASPSLSSTQQGRVRREAASSQFYIRVFPNAVLSRASPPDAPLRCWVVPMPAAAASSYGGGGDGDDEHDEHDDERERNTFGPAASTGETTNIAESLDIDESDTFQYLWTAFAHVLNESVPLDVQLIVRTPSGTDRKIFGKLSDEDVKMGLPCGATSPSSPRSAASVPGGLPPVPTSPLNISRSTSVDIAGTEDLLAALDSIDIDDVCAYAADHALPQSLPQSLSSLSLSPSSPRSTASPGPSSAQALPLQTSPSTSLMSGSASSSVPDAMETGPPPATSRSAPPLPAPPASDGGAVNTVFPMYFAVAFPDIVVKALDQIQRSGQALPIDEIRLPHEALKSLPLKHNRHNSTMRAVLYRGSWLEDRTYLSLNP